MRMRIWLLAVVVAGLVAGACKDDPARPDAKIDAEVELDAFVAPWWTPTPGSAKNWDLQLVNPNVTELRAMYDVDLWDVTTARTITYSSGPTVAVPAGAHAGLINTIHAKTPKPVVICHFDTAAVDLATDPDRMKFPGYEANPPNSPNSPSTGSVIGWSITGLTASHRWLDLRPATRGLWKEVLEKRMQLAKDNGCDGVDTGRSVPYGFTGFGDLAIADLASFLEGLATALHTRTLSGGSRLSFALLSDEIDDDFDWLLFERCVENSECDAARPFINARKAVFAVEYDPPTTMASACNIWPDAQIEDGIIKHDPPAGDFRQACN